MMAHTPILTCVSMTLSDVLAMTSRCNDAACNQSFIVLALTGTGVPRIAGSVCAAGCVRSRACVRSRTCVRTMWRSCLGVLTIFCNHLLVRSWSILNGPIQPAESVNLVEWRHLRHAIARFDYPASCIPRPGLNPIGPIAPSWAPRPRGPALECNLLSACQVQTLVQVDWEPGSTETSVTFCSSSQDRKVLMISW